MNALAIIIFILVVSFILYKGYKLMFDKKPNAPTGSGGSVGGGGDEGDRTWDTGDDDDEGDNIDYPKEV